MNIRFSAVAIFVVLTCAILIPSSGSAATRRIRFTRARLQSSEMALDFDWSHGISITGIRDLVTGNVFLSDARSLFELAPDPDAISCPGAGTPLSSNTGLTVDQVDRSAVPRSLIITAHVSNVPALHVILTVDLPPSSKVATLNLAFFNTAGTSICVRAVFPKLVGLTAPGNNPIGAVPTEVGGIAPLSAGLTLGMPFDRVDVGVPRSMNPVEVATIYDPGGLRRLRRAIVQAPGTGGLFFADVDGNPDEGVPSLQFTLSPNEADGFWVGQVPPFQRGSPNVTLAMGVYHSGDWHNAVDYWLQTHASRIRTPSPATPDWLRHAGAIYTFAGGGAGGIYIAHNPLPDGPFVFPAPPLIDRLKDDPNCTSACHSSFLNLPRLLDEANDFGTNVVYLWDYWQGTEEGGLGAYFNKGDYIPRADLDGERALIDGIAAIHARGGKIILYVEPFIAYQFSQVGMQHGTEWEAWDAFGPMFGREPYTGNYKMVAADPRWQSHLADVCTRLVQNYGADGIFLDSGGWQLNWPVKSGANGAFLSSSDYTLGFFELVDELRSIVGPDKVILGETTSGPVAGHWDGGFSADFSFNAPYSGEKIIGSPVRYALPGVSFFTNGQNLAEMNQMYAAGHNLALCCDFDAPGNFLFQNKDYVRTLVQIRQNHAAALVEGMQLYQPVARNSDSTTNADVIAYFYHSTNEDVITVVNTGTAIYNGTLLLSASETGIWSWLDLLHNTTSQSHDRILSLPSGPGLGPGELLILSRQNTR